MMYRLEYYRDSSEHVVLYCETFERLAGLYLEAIKSADTYVMNVQVSKAEWVPINWEKDESSD